MLEITWPYTLEEHWEMIQNAPAQEHHQNYRNFLGTIVSPTAPSQLAVDQFSEVGGRYPYIPSMGILEKLRGSVAEALRQGNLMEAVTVQYDFKWGDVGTEHVQKVQVQVPICLWLPTLLVRMEWQDLGGWAQMKLLPIGVEEQVESIEAVREQYRDILEGSENG